MELALERGGSSAQHVSKRPYRGVNFFLLSATKHVSLFWLTLKQANELDGSGRTGQRAKSSCFGDSTMSPISRRSLTRRSWSTKSIAAVSFSDIIGWNVEQSPSPQVVLDKLPEFTPRLIQPTGQSR